MALPLSAEQMITIGEAYYSDIREEMSIPRTQEIVAGPLVVPQDGEPRGVAVQRGLKELLNSPNIYPVGDNSRQVRMCVQLFDNCLARVNDRDNDWRTQREICIRYYYAIYDHIPDQRLQGHNIIGHKKHIRKSFDDQKNWIAALLICKCAYGWGMKAHEMEPLWKMGLLPHNRLVHHMFVLPMVYFLCTEMNPHDSLNYRVILKLNLNRLENNCKSKFRDYGAYSMDEALRRMSLNPATHPMEVITYMDASMCSGIEFRFLRIFSLIIPEFKWKFCQYRRKAAQLWLTDEEKNSLYRGLDSRYVVPRYGKPSYP